MRKRPSLTPMAYHCTQECRQKRQEVDISVYSDALKLPPPLSPHPGWGRNPDSGPLAGLNDFMEGLFADLNPTTERRLATTDPAAEQYRHHNPEASARAPGQVAGQLSIGQKLGDAARS